MNDKVIIVAVLLSFVLGISSCVNSYPSSQPTNVLPAPAPQTSSMPTTNPETTPQTTATPEVPATATPVVPGPPNIPPEVLSIWNASPTSDVLSPYTSGTVTLKANLHGAPAEPSGDNGNLGVSYYAISTGADQTSTKFYLEEGQWIDVIVTSVDIPIYFKTNKTGGVSFSSSTCRDTVSGNIVVKPLGLVDIPNAFHHPYSEKALYENRATSTNTGSASSSKTTLFNTAARIFAWGGAGEYDFEFTNFNSQNGADIQYRVYKLGATPAWGNKYTITMLAPWLNELHRLLESGIISKDEFDKAIGQWLEQLR